MQGLLFVHSKNHMKKYLSDFLNSYEHKRNTERKRNRYQ
jgi:hypothetical protein